MSTFCPKGFNDVHYGVGGFDTGWYSSAGAGGYVVALSVILADLWKVGFATPLRDSIQFRYCTVDAARGILLAQEGSTDKAFVT